MTGTLARCACMGGLPFNCRSGLSIGHCRERGGREWMEKGAQLGRPQCLVTVGGWLMTGGSDYPKDVRRGMNMIFDGIRNGYIHGVGSLRVEFVNGGLESPKNRLLEYCWGYHAAKIRPNDADLALSVYIEKLPSEQQPSLKQELDQLRQWHPNIEECIGLTKQTFGD